MIFPSGFAGNSDYDGPHREKDAFVNRVTFDEDNTIVFGEKGQQYRVTTSGVYHLRKWNGEFSYLEAMSFDTPILDDEVIEELRKEIESFSIYIRLRRAKIFKKYLVKNWHRSKLSLPYFNWTELMKNGERSFEQVERAVSRLGSHPR